MKLSSILFRNASYNDCDLNNRAPHTPPVAMQRKRIRIYGQDVDLVSHPVTLHEQSVFIEGIELRSGETRKIRLPLATIRMVHRGTSWRPEIRECFL